MDTAANAQGQPRPGPRMGPPSPCRAPARQHNPARTALLTAPAWLAALVACATPEPAAWSDALRRQAAELEEALARGASESLAPGAARVRLAFGPEADLDLYVTDPLSESLYFANTPTRSGGELDADQTCDDPAPRVETALLSPASPGRYRVGVDFMTRCQRGAARVPFAVEVLADGLRRLERGLIDFGHFEPLVLQFEIEPR